MTKKHFKAIAEILQKHEPQVCPSPAHTKWSNLCGDIADYFRSENLRFDRLKFFATCCGES